MKFHLLSDLHNEFILYQHPFKRADVLLLAGDICVAALLQPHRTDKDALKHKDRMKNFFERAVKTYKKIFYVTGNHEHYHCDFLRTLPILQEFLKDFPKVQLLNQDEVILNNGVVVLGVPLWTNLNNADKTTMESVAMMMNDYRLITYDHYRTLEPMDTLAVHEKNVAWLEERINFHKDSKVILMGHQAPSKKSTHPRYKDDYEMNGGYSSNLEHLMKDNVVLFCHGHTHDSFDYYVKKTRVICNPSGYWVGGQYENPKFNPNLIIEI